MGLFIANGTGSLTPQVISSEVLSRHNVYGVVFDGISSKGKPLYNAIDQKWTPQLLLTLELILGKIWLFSM